MDVVTALHVAVFYDRVDIAQLLLEAGAHVDSTSTQGVSPIEWSGSSEMTSLLMTFGASTGPVLSMSIMEVISYWGSSIYTKAGSFKNINTAEATMHVRQRKELWLGLDALPQRFDEYGEDWRQLLAVRHLQGPLINYVRLDPKLVNHLLSFNAGHSFLLNSDLELGNLAPFPWHQIRSDAFERMHFLRNTFRPFQRRLSRPIFKQWLNLEPDQGWSPLCRAASVEFLDAMENCLSMGADIDFEGCSWGSALMIASACGKLAAVKCLDRAGAKIDYIGSSGHTSALSLTTSEVVKQWLLVGRLVEQKKMAAATECDKKHSMGQMGRRSGIAKIKVRLNELYYRRYRESSLDYLRRLERLKLEIRGRIPYYTEGVIYDDTR